MDKKYYQILGVDENSTIEEIKKAYKKKTMEYHPDINNNLDNEDMIKEINLAYEKIMERKKNMSNISVDSNTTTNNTESFNSMSNNYKTSGTDFDVNYLDPDCIFVGDIYVVRYKFKLIYDECAPFKEQTYMKLKRKNAILLRIGFERYVDISKIKCSTDLEQLKTDIKNREQVTILGNFFKPFVGDLVALNVKSYYELNEPENPKEEKSRKKLAKVMSYKK